MIEFVIIALLWIHFIADFLFQNDEMALNKSSSISWLAFHSIVYGSFFILLVPYVIATNFALIFLSANTVLHFVVDFITSKLTTSLYKKGERHWFFVVIGLDQTIHITSLIVMYFYYLYSS